MSISRAPLLAALASLATLKPAAADDAADCDGADPAVGIPACTRLIEAAAPADAVVAAYVRRAKHRIFDGDLETALEDIDEALRLDPTHADAHHNLGIVYSFQGRYEEALDALDEAIRSSPETSAESRHTRGRIRLATGDLDAALAEFDAALEVDGRHVDTLISRGGTYQLAGDVDRALADYDAALRIDADRTRFRIGPSCTSRRAATTRRLPISIARSS
jgi:tetratricopeptide (TPR) repeat protein